MNFKRISEIHNENFKQKYEKEYFERLNNIYKIYEIKDIAYLILLDSIDVYEIFEIAVAKKEQNKGYGFELLKKLPNDRKIFLEVSQDNENAIKLYEKSGFKKISVRKNYYGSTSALIMEK